MASFSALLKEQIYIIGNSRQPSVTQVLCLTQQTNAQERLSTIGLLELLTNILTNEKEQKGERSDQIAEQQEPEKEKSPMGSLALERNKILRKCITARGNELVE